ncbi:MAG: TRAP transporter large permease subunit, partial [Oscillospiraceae bacterium]
AHMFIFYFGCISSITPPVALAAYAAAGLAGCDPNRAGYKAFRLAICAFIMPFMFVYNPVLLMDGAPLAIIQCAITALMGAYLLASGIEGFFFNWKLTIPERPLLIVAALMLIVPGTITDLVGLAILLAEFATGKIFKRKEKFVPIPTVVHCDKQ